MSDDPVPTPRYVVILANAARLARDLGHQHVGAEHLFLAIIQDPHAIPTQVLAKIVDLPEVEGRLLGVMGSSAYSTGGSTTSRPPGEEDVN